MRAIKCVCLTLALCLTMTVGVAAADTPTYQTYTIETMFDQVFTFEAARKVTRTVTYEYNYLGYSETSENAEVYLLKPGSAISVKTASGTESKLKCLKFRLQGDGTYRSTLGPGEFYLTSGNADTWFEDMDMQNILVERIMEKKEVNFYGELQPIEIEMMVSERVIFVMEDNQVPEQEQPATGFTDVAASAYYADAVAWAVEKGITSGTGDGTTFSPNATCTTAQILTFLWRANGSPAPTGNNAAVPAGQYYTDAANWALEKGLTDNFSADTPATRAATVTYLWKLAGKPAAEAAAFTDVDAGAEYAQAVAWAVKKGVTAGTSATTFAPDNTCTRGQIVTFLHRDLA